VSRSPAHYALQTLMEEGRLKRAEGRGYVVPMRNGSSAPASTRAQLLPEPIVQEPAWKTIHAEVEHEIATRILFRSFRIHEAGLATAFGVSRTVARDVLQRMHATGMIGKDHGGRWHAERVTPERIHNLYEMRWLLEPQALRDAGPRTPAPTWSRMLAQVKRVIDAYPDVRGADLEAIEHDLHVDLLGACRNHELSRVLRQTQLLLISNRYMFDDFLGVPSGIAEASLREHRRVLLLGSQGRHDDAARVLELHLKRSCRHWLQRLDRMEGVREPRPPAYVLLT
jgi:DNA-binding GntR family transcriptional regulator